MHKRYVRLSLGAARQASERAGAYCTVIVIVIVIGGLKSRGLTNRPIIVCAENRLSLD
jgi:hypothetical protein